MNPTDIIAHYKEPGKFLCLDKKRKKYYTVTGNEQIVYHNNLRCHKTAEVSVSPSGKYILFLYQDDKAAVHDMETGEIVYTRKPGKDTYIYSAEFVNDDHIILTLSGKDCFSQDYILLCIADGREIPLLELRQVESATYRITKNRLAVLCQKRDRTFHLVAVNLFTGAIEAKCDDFSFMPYKNLLIDDSPFSKLPKLSADAFSFLCFYRGAFSKISPCYVNWKEKTYKILSTYPRKELSINSFVDSWIGWLNRDRFIISLKDRVEVHSFLQAKRLAVCYDSDAEVVLNDDNSIQFYFDENAQGKETFTLLSVWRILKKIWKTEYKTKDENEG